MVKKLISMALTLAMILGLQVVGLAAETDVINQEAEVGYVSNGAREIKVYTGDLSGWVPENMTNPSGGGFIRCVEAKADATKREEITYTVNARYTGMYEMDIYASDPNNEQYKSHWMLRVNDNYYNVTTESTNWQDMLHIDRCKAKVKLNSGENTITIRLGGTRKANAAMHFYMDNFVLTYNPNLKVTDVTSIEGESIPGLEMSAASGNKKLVKVNDSDSSGGAYIRAHKSGSNEPELFNAAYTVTMQEAGIYGMQLFGTVWSGCAQCSNYCMTINGKVYEPRYAGKYADEHVDHLYAEFPLEQGENTIYFECSSKGNKSGENVYFIIDRFDLEYLGNKDYADKFIKVEGEDFNVCSEYYIKNDPSGLIKPLSGGYCGQITGYSGWAEYEFYAPVAGMYGMELYGTNPNESGHSAYTMTVNGTEYPIRFKKYDNRQFRHNYADVLLKQGVNKVKFNIDKKATTGVTNYYFFMDKFTFNYNPILETPYKSNNDIVTGSFNINNVILHVNDTINITADGIDESGKAVEGCSATYKSNDENVAKIENNMLIATGVGSTVVEAEIHKGDAVVMAFAEVNVYDDSTTAYVVDKNFAGDAASIKLVNADEINDLNTNVIYAIYDGTKLKDITVRENINVGPARTLDISLVNDAFSEGNTVKLFCWDSMDNISPMAAVIQ